MKDNKLTQKFWARALAFGLCCALMAGFAMSACCVILASRVDWLPQMVSDGNYALWEGISRNLAANTVYALLQLVGAITLFVFLLCSAGHKEGTDEVILRGQDKVPLDLHFFVCSALAVPLGMLGVMLCSFGTWEYPSLLVLGICVGAAGVTAVALMFFMTLAVRVKLGKWWRNTIIYKILEGIIGLIRLIPKSWRATLVFIGYLFVNAMLAAILFSSRSLGILFSLTALLALNGAALAFLLRCIYEMRLIRSAGEALTNGDLEQTVDVSRLHYAFRAHGENLNSISLGMSRAVNEKLKSERFKTELITNVSHDLKTPLTSIITYADLLEKCDVSDDKAKEYIETISRQSAKLKKLTEDLIDASKASAGAVSVNFEQVNATELVAQCAGEYQERMAEAGITPVVAESTEDVYITADGRLLWRVMDNLMQNICKHGMRGTRAYIGVVSGGENGSAVVSFKNISSEPLNMPAEELMERFVQGDGSRSKGGSGLGLSIAQSLTELMKGEMKLSLDGDLFKAELVFPRCAAPVQPEEK